MGLFGDLVNAFEVPRKSKASAYSSLIFLGLFGWHEFYLEKYLRGILYIVSFVAFAIGWFKPIPILAYISAGILTFFFVFDLFTLRRQVDKWNNENAGNPLINTASEIAVSVISIPLNNAIEEYNGVVEDFKKSIETFNEKKSEVEDLMGDLQEARKDTHLVIFKMKEIVDNIAKKDKELVLDELGEDDNLLEGIMDQVFEKEELSLIFQDSVDIATQEMTATFNAARELTEELESNAGKFALATAATVIQGIVEYGRQQEKIIELKEGREDILKQQNKVEIKIRQLEATEKRAAEILKVIEGEMPGFNYFYDEFCKAVFPDGILEQKEAASLSIEERKILMDLATAARKVIAAGSQKIR